MRLFIVTVPTPYALSRRLTLSTNNYMNANLSDGCLHGFAWICIHLYTVLLFNKNNYLLANALRNIDEICNYLSYTLTILKFKTTISI